MRLNTRVCVLLLSVVTAVTATVVRFSIAQSSDPLDMCSSSDAVCVGRILQEQIERICGGSSAPAAAWRVEYFFETGCRGDPLAVLPALPEGGRAEICESLGVRTVWSIRPNGGTCITLAAQTTLPAACLRFQ